MEGENLDFKSLIQLKKEKELAKNSQYKVDSKDRLGKISIKKIKTTMIGALDTIERHFGFLWQLDEDGKMSKEAAHMKEIYDKVREEILDNGNNQIRNFLAELEQYDIEWLRYKITLPVKQPGSIGGQNEE